MWQQRLSDQGVSYYSFYNGSNWRVDVHFGQNVAKNTDYIKKCFKQKLFRIKFPSKNVWVHISISPRSGAMGLQRLPFLKYYNVLEWEKRFILWLNGAKNTYDIKKCLELNFLQKTQRSISLSPPVVELGVPKICHFWNIMHWNGNGEFSEPLVPLLGETKTWVHQVFCRKFNFIQFLFEAFSNTIGNCCSIQPWSEATFPFQYIIIFQKWQSLWASLYLHSWGR